MRRFRRNQTSLPDDLVEQPNEPVFSTGLTRDSNKPGPNQPTKRPASRAPTLIRNPNHQFYSSRVPVQTSENVVLGASSTRRYLLLQNTGLSAIYIAFNAVAGQNGENSFELPAGAGITFENGIVPNGGISAVSPTGSFLSIVEGREE